MQVIPQIMPISNLRTNYTDVLTKLDNGPVILSQRGTPTAVILSAFEWDQTARELQRLRRLELGDRASDEIKAGNFVTEEDIDAQFAAMGIGDG
ncbi:MAG: type II toxin-antitoxin system Phd/YefM family antitoxin [Chloroflexota bacterium]